MDIIYASWGSPVGIGLFFAGMGVFFWGFFRGIAAIMRAKHAIESNGETSTSD